MDETKTSKVKFGALPPQTNNKVNFAINQKNNKNNDNSDSFETESDSFEEKKFKREVEEAKQSWNVVSQEHKTINDEVMIERGVGGQIIDRSTPITYFDSVIFIRKQAESITSENVTVKFNRRTFFCLKVKPTRQVNEAYNEILRCCKIKFMENELTHHRILNTLHSLITGVSNPPLRKGAHWEDIGFQTKDPISDLRCLGMMGLILPIGIFSRHKAFAQRVIQISRHKENQFPLMLVVLLFVKEAIDLTQNSDIILESPNENVWDGILTYLSGLLKIAIDRWESECLNFTDDFNVFDKIIINGRMNISGVMSEGFKASQMTETSTCKLKDDTSRI